MDSTIKAFALTVLLCVPATASAVGGSSMGRSAPAVTKRSAGSPAGDPAGDPGQVSLSGVIRLASTLGTAGPALTAGQPPNTLGTGGTHLKGLTPTKDASKGPAYGGYNTTGISAAALEAYTIYCNAHAQDCQDGGGGDLRELQSEIDLGATAEQAAGQAWTFFQEAEEPDGVAYQSSYNCHARFHGCDQGTAYGYGLSAKDFALRFKVYYYVGETPSMKIAASQPGITWDQSLLIDPYLPGGAKNPITADGRDCANTGWGFIKGPDGHNIWAGVDFNTPPNVPATAENTPACQRLRQNFLTSLVWNPTIGHWQIVLG